MVIVSISLPDQSLRDLDALQKTTGHSGRSELVRAAIASFAEHHATATINPSQHYAASLSVIVAETQRRAVHDVLHEHQSLVRTQSHLCVDKERCLELLGLHGSGATILSLAKALEAVPKVERVTIHAERCGDHAH